MLSAHNLCVSQTLYNLATCPISVISHSLQGLFCHTTFPIVAETSRGRRHWRTQPVFYVLGVADSCKFRNST